MLKLDEAFPASVALPAREWFAVWGLAALADSVRLRFSRRMFRAVGRCYPQRRLVSLAAAVADMEQSQIRAILCHEFAHIAAFEIHGRGVRPHGPQWQALVHAAGFTPQVRFEDEASIALLRNSVPRRARYVHVCRRCAAQRISSRRMTRWRCGACYEIGFDGRLDIVRLMM